MTVVRNIENSVVIHQGHSLFRCMGGFSGAGWVKPTPDGVIPNPN